jgi:hypothetical protein
MKKSLFLSMILLLFIGLNTGCDKLDITEDIEFDITFSGNSTTADYAGEELFDAAANSDDIDKYADKIETIEVLEITAELTSFNGPAGQKIVTGTLDVSDENGGGREVIAIITDQALEPMLNNPIPLTFNQAGIDRLAELIKNDPHKALVRNFGTTDSSPIDFVCKIKIKVRMTANPL